MDLSNIPLVGRLFGEADGVSFSTLDDAQHVVERLQGELDLRAQAMVSLEAHIKLTQRQRIEELKVDLEELREQRKGLTRMLAFVDESIAAKEEAVSAANEALANMMRPEEEEEEKQLPLEVLRREDDSSTNAIISKFGDDDVFVAKSREATESLLARDAEDDKKLSTGIALAVSRGVLSADVVTGPVTRIDVTDKSADKVADDIFSKCGGGKDQGGAVVVLQGLSGTGKGTTVSKLMNRFDRCVSWSNGNVFRALTLLALRHCEQETQLDEAVLTRENLNSWISLLRFDLFSEGYDIEIDLGDDEKVRVSEIANTMLKEPRIGKAIPTVAGYSQGEVINFANGALERMRQDGLTCIVEGRAPTLAYVRSSLRFELVIDDPLLLGKRRVAQRLVGAVDLDERQVSQNTVEDVLKNAMTSL